MSFSIGIPAGPAADFKAAAIKAKDTYVSMLETNDVTAAPATVESIDVAIKAAAAIVAAGVVGEGAVAATITGHANPDHKPVKGWANDLVTVSVSCTDPQPTQ